MPIQKSDYETLLSEYSNPQAAIALLRQYRPYLEMIPSMRRPDDSIIPIPLPVVRVRQAKSSSSIAVASEAISLPCDIAIVMCDPEWKIKMGVEIFVLIHRPQEDFSDLLMRWRQTQVALSRDYEWIMPPRYQHILSEGAEKIYPLFVILPETPERIKRGLTGACLPFVVRATASLPDSEIQTEAVYPDFEVEN